jgi:hypothetical protein
MGIDDDFTVLAKISMSSPTVLALSPSRVNDTSVVMEKSIHSRLVEVFLEIQSGPLLLRFRFSVFHTWVHWHDEGQFLVSEISGLRPTLPSSFFLTELPGFPRAAI